MDHYRADENTHRETTRGSRCIPGLVWLIGNGIALAVLITWLT